MTDDDKLIDSQGNVDEDELDRRLREMGLDQSSEEDEEIKLELGEDDSPTYAQKIEAVKEEARRESDKIDDEFSARLKALEEKAKTHKLVRDDQKRETQRQMDKDRDSARGLGIGLSIAYTLIGCPILGLIIGFLLDGSSGGMTFKNWGVGLGSLLGIVLTFVLLSRMNQRQ